MGSVVKGVGMLVGGVLDAVGLGYDAGGNFASKLLEPLYNHPTPQPQTKQKHQEKTCFV